MQLTDRQCWDIIRQMVKDKNDEYRKFLFSRFGDNAIGILGNTQKVFLDNYKVEAVSKNWLDDLSSEDLLIFLDFRCRILQKMYDHYKMNNTIRRSNVKLMIQYNQLSGMALHNGGKLMFSGRPKAVDNEVSVDKLEEDLNDLRELALVKVMGNIAVGYAKKHNVSIDYAARKVKELKTTTKNEQGNVLGYKLKGDIQLPERIIENLVQPEVVKTEKEPTFEMVGFNVDGVRTFKCGDKYVDFFGRELEVDAIYDVDGNMIKDLKEETKSANDVMDAKLKGWDIHGSPVYEKDGVYYSSVGKRLPDDVFIDTSYNR
jgi:hypothetical protein